MLYAAYILRLYVVHVSMAVPEKDFSCSKEILYCRDAFVIVKICVVANSELLY